MRIAIIVFGALAGAAALGCSQGRASVPEGGAERPKADYDPKTGRLTRLTFDANENGRNDAVSVMDGTRIDRIEVDTDENGAIDRWDFYDRERRLVRVGISHRNDGIIDAFAYYGHDQIVTRREVSTGRDNRFDRVELYEAGLLARVEEDTDGDGRVDKWEVYRPDAHAPPGEPPSTVASAAFDDARRGRPTRRLVFAEDGSVQHVEIDPDGDGIFTEVGTRRQ